MKERNLPAVKIVNIDLHLALKKYILFFVVTFAAITTVKAQSGYNYYELGVGIDASYIRGYTNITKQYDHPALNLNFIYNYNPYFPIEAELQVGQLSGGGLLPSQDKYGREYTNNYKALLLHADVQLGTMIDYGDSWFLNAVKGFFVGTGVAVIDNSNTVQRTSIYDPTYVFPGKNNSIDFMLPLRAGYEYKFFDSYDEPSVAIEVGYIHNIAFGEGLDGYDDPTSKFKNNALDQYRQIFIGVKYFFGTTVSYNKLVRTYRY